MTDVERETGAAPRRRSQAKADRRRELLRAAARLIAERGFPGVRLEDLGAAVGISGPAVYRHFPNKNALLVELLTDISGRLLAGGIDVAERVPDPRRALEELVDFHLDFALGEPDLIRVQDRDLHSLPDDARHRVRQTQRRYVEIWVDVLQQMHAGVDDTRARIVAHATFGLINSTPYSAASPSVEMTNGDVRGVLRRMALAALTTEAG